MQGFILNLNHNIEALAGMKWNGILGLITSERGDPFRASIVANRWLVIYADVCCIVIFVFEIHRREKFYLSLMSERGWTVHISNLL